MNMTCENLGARAITEIPANRITRRNLLAGVGAVLAGVGLVGPAETAMAAAKTYTVGKTTDIKVGSSKSYLVAGVSLLITQPKKGVFKAFKGICTHQGGKLTSLSGPNLFCPLHGASFDSTTGKVLTGPASTPLKTYKVTVSGKTLKVSI
jgi:nitrite reductase/ring-hydroxylating ferredoxin subunit